MKNTKLLPLLLIIIIFVAGCTSQKEITQLIKTLPEVSEFLEQHPNADIKAVLWTKNVVERNIEDIRKDCGEQVGAGKYWKVVVKEGDVDITVWIDDEIKEPFCIIRHGTKGITTSTTTGEIEDTSPTDDITDLTLVEVCWYLIDYEFVPFEETDKPKIQYDPLASEIRFKIKNTGDLDFTGIRINELTIRLDESVGEDVYINNEKIDIYSSEYSSDGSKSERLEVSSPHGTTGSQPPEVPVPSYHSFTLKDIDIFKNRKIKAGETFLVIIQADIPGVTKISLEIEPRFKYGDIITSCPGKRKSTSLKIQEEIRPEDIIYPVSVIGEEEFCKRYVYVYLDDEIDGRVVPVHFIFDNETKELKFTIYNTGKVDLDGFLVHMRGAVQNPNYLGNEGDELYLSDWIKIAGDKVKIHEREPPYNDNFVVDLDIFENEPLKIQEKFNVKIPFDLKDMIFVENFYLSFIFLIENEGEIVKCPDPHGTYQERGGSIMVYGIPEPPPP